MSKQLLFNSESRKKIKEGIDKAADAIRCTMGAAGRTVLISNPNQDMHITKDGYNISQSINLKDEIENTGVTLVKGLTRKVVKDAGDASTGATVLFQELISQSFKNIEAGASSVELKKGIEKALYKVVDALKAQSISIQDNKDMVRQVATVSANNDEQIGTLIANAFSVIGNDGIILIEEGKSVDTKVRIDDGYQFERGLTSPFWVTNKEKMIAELVNPMIVLVDGKIERFADLKPLLESMMKAKKTRDILIIADTIEGEAFDTLLYNKIQGVLNVVCVNAPSYGERRTQMMEDLAIITGGTYFSVSNGNTLDNADISMCGSCEKVTITKDTTTIVNGDCEKSDIAKRSLQIQALIDQSESDVEAEMLKQRKAKLNGGIAVISVGGATEIEMKEKKDRVDDAIRATKCAIEEGIVAGGGTALIRCISSLDGIETSSPDERTGVEILKKSIESPLRQIASNAGQIGDVYVEKVKEQTGNFGYNVKTDRIEDLVQSGIIDATKVVRISLENAVSTACMVIISECLIVEVAD